jgi:hypothetical protein
MNPYANTHGSWHPTCVDHPQFLYFGTCPLQVCRRENGLPDMVFTHDRKIEDGKHRVSDELVDDTIAFPHSRSAFIIKPYSMPTTSAESDPWESVVYPRKSAKKTVAGIITCFRPLTLVNMVSQMLHRFGFIRLILMPSSLNGIDSGPRMGIGMCMCCQHPLQIIDSETDM